MTDDNLRIAAKVRGIAAENNTGQSGLADILGIDRKTAHGRWHGKVPFTAPEILKLSRAMQVPVSRFFPESVDALLGSERVA